MNKQMNMQWKMKGGEPVPSHDRQRTKRSRMRQSVVVAWLAVAASAAALSAAPRQACADEPKRDHHIVAEDYFDIAVITDAVFSPDGKQVAYVDLRWQPPDERRNADLWIADVQGGATRRLTFDNASDGHPRFSPDGAWLYFSASRKRAGEDKPPYDGTTQVWRISAAGGEEFPVTRVKDGIQAFELAADGNAIYYIVGEKQKDDDFKELYDKYDKLTVGHGVVEFSVVHRLDLRSWRSEKLIEDKRVIRDFAVSNDDARIAMITAPTGELISHEGRSRVDIFDRKTGEITQVPDQLFREDAPSPFGWLESLAWSRDGSMLAFQVSFDGYPTEVIIAHWTEGKVATQRLQRPDQVHVVAGSRMHWRGDSRDLCFIAEDRGRCRVYGVTSIGKGMQGRFEAITPGDVCVDTMTMTPAGDRVAAVLSTTTHPPDIFVYAATPSGSQAEAQRITRVNPQVDNWKLPSIQTVSWTGWNGDTVEGILELPPDHQPGKPLPMIVELHGGPTAASLLRLRFWIYGRVLMASRGYALLSPNYRGSTGYGDRFMIELVGHKNDRDVIDILAGVDAMIAQGIADPDRLGVMGWSNGGYLTNCLITTTDRFKVASSGAGVFDVTMQWAAEDTPGHVINFQQGLPWDQPEKMRASSPLYKADNITTPTLIHVGQNDPRCPPAHSKALFRAMHEYLHVPAQLVVYPGEGHGLTTYEHRKAKMEWDIAWFDKYLPVEPDETTATQNEAAPPVS